MINYNLVRERLKQINKSICDSGFQFEMDTFDILSSQHDLTDVLFYDKSYYNLKNNLLILVLICDDVCVSTITCNIRDSFISISSKTHPLHVGKKYNLLLRSTLIMLGGLIRENDKRVSMIKSFATNVASEASLTKYFDVVHLPDYVFHLTCDANNKKKAKTLFDEIVIPQCRCKV